MFHRGEFLLANWKNTVGKHKPVFRKPDKYARNHASFEWSARLSNMERLKEKYLYNALLGILSIPQVNRVGTGYIYSVLYHVMIMLYLQHVLLSKLIGCTSTLWQKQSALPHPSSSCLGRDRRKCHQLGCKTARVITSTSPLLNMIMMINSPRQ